MRLTHITGYDLNVFDFDHDLTWAAFFMNADGHIYGRFGGRDPSGPDSRNNLKGLQFSMEQALKMHASGGRSLTSAVQEPVYVENYPSARKVVKNGCIHCHQINEIRRHEAKQASAWRRDSVWVYPLPENVGITLHPERGNLVKGIAAESPAFVAGLQADDVIDKLNGRNVFSFADAQYALHHAPEQGEIDITWRRSGDSMHGKLKLAYGWRKTDLTWRPSMLDLLPRLMVAGTDLTAEEKKSLGLNQKQFAFRQADPIHSEAQAMGIRTGDIILGVDSRELQMDMLSFTAYVRQNYLVGDRLTLNVLREGKRINLTTRLR